jgi:hypothetical protein
MTPSRALEEGLAACLGRRLRVTGMECRPLEASTHPIDRLRVTLDSGEQLPVVFKRLRAEDDPKGHRREVLVYRRLLTGRRFGAPLAYASVYDEARGSYWLFLEDVGEGSVGTGDLEDWAAAVRRLAEMHGTYLGREGELRALGCLGEHGADYYHGLANKARCHLRLAGAHRALARFDGLMARYGDVVDHLVRQPRTLVHGDVYPDNFLLQPGGEVRVIDWESAAVGLAALDLARLLDGWGTDRPALVEAYREELVKHAKMPFDRDAFDGALWYCETLTTLIHLGWEEEHCRDAAFVEDSLRHLERVWRPGERERGTGTW